MPTYEYLCATCKKTFDVFQGMNDPLLKKCPTCKKPVTRLLGAGAGFVFKGTGFYQTDYKRSGKPPEGKPAEAKPAEKSSDKLKSSKETKEKKHASD